MLGSTHLLFFFPTICNLYNLILRSFQARAKLSLSKSYIFLRVTESFIWKSEVALLFPITNDPHSHQKFLEVTLPRLPQCPFTLCCLFPSLTINLNFSFKKLQSKQNISTNSLRYTTLSEILTANKNPRP